MADDDPLSLIQYCVCLMLLHGSVSLSLHNCNVIMVMIFAFSSCKFWVMEVLAWRK